MPGTVVPIPDDLLPDSDDVPAGALRYAVDHDQARRHLITYRRAAWPTTWDHVSDGPGVRHAVPRFEFAVGPVCRLNRDLDVCAACGVRDREFMVAVTGTWTRIEVSGALVRAARAGRGDEKGLLAILDADLGIDGPVTVVSANQVDIESEALVMVRVHGLRAMDAWHLAVAGLVLPDLLEPGEKLRLPPATRFRRTRDGGLPAVIGFGVALGRIQLGCRVPVKASR